MTDQEQPHLLPRPVRVPAADTTANPPLSSEGANQDDRGDDNRRRRRRPRAVPYVEDDYRPIPKPVPRPQALDLSRIKPEMPDIFATLDAKAEEIHGLLAGEGEDYNLAQVKRAMCEWIERSIIELVDDAEWHCVTGGDRYSFNQGAFTRALEAARSKNIVPKPNDVNQN